MKNLNYNLRLNKVKEALEEKKIDLLLLTPSVNFGYLFKNNLSMRERLICSMVSRDEAPKLIAPSFEEERMRKSTNIKQIIPWKENEDPYKKVSDNTDGSVNRIALEPSTPFEVYLRLQKNFPDAEFVSAMEIVNKMRAMKSEAEVQRIKKAMEYTIEAMKDTVAQFKVGTTEKEIQKILLKQMNELSGEISWALVQFAENSAIPHASSSEKKLKRDDVVLIDAGTSVDGYFSDITITTVFGKPNEKFMEIYNIVQHANDKALETSKKGIIAERVDQAARKVIEDKGYGKYFTHRLGHGLGLEIHEPPYIVEGNKEKLVTGNVHTDEPGIYLPGKFGVRIEDDIIVGKKSTRIHELNREIFWEK